MVNIKKTKRLQRGGVAKACVLNTAMTPNIHNPQAAGDLDDYPVPLGADILQGGSCGDSGVGTSHPKSETFKQYLQSLDHNLDHKGIMSGGTAQSPPIPPLPSSAIGHTGGGVTTDVSEMIAGQPVYKGYDDGHPPALINGKLLFGTPDKSICRGGGKTRKHKNKKNKRSRKQYQKGGAPAPYNEAFNGPQSMFMYPDDMSKHTFDETQPNWSPNAI